MLAVIAEFEPRHKFWMSEHSCHALPVDVVVDGQGLVSARRGSIHAASVESNFDQGTVFSGWSFESSWMFSIGNGVDSNVAILTRG